MNFHDNLANQSFFRDELQRSKTPHELLTTYGNGDQLPFQRWYKFKEAFSPQLVLDVIDECEKAPKFVVDPFGGSGTTALLCRMLNTRCTTIEVNPFLADLIRCKTENYVISDLIADFAAICGAVQSPRGFTADFSFLPPTFVAGIEKDRWIFEEEVAERVFHYLTAMDQLDSHENRRLLRILLGACLLDVSNVRISGKGRRYKKNWHLQRASASDLDRLLEDKFQQALADIARWFGGKKGQTQVLFGDSRHQLENVDSGIDLAIFSPPYPNSFDYTDVYNIELWMLGYLRSFGENRVLRESTLRSHVQVKRDFSYEGLSSAKLEGVISQLANTGKPLWSPHIPSMLGAYFADLKCIVEKLTSKLSSDGTIALIVGDSMYSGVMVPVADIIEEVANNMGLVIHEVREARSMRSSPQQGGKLELGEYLIKLKL